MNYRFIMKRFSTELLQSVLICWMLLAVSIVFSTANGQSMTASMAKPVGESFVAAGLIILVAMLSFISVWLLVIVKRQGRELKAAVDTIRQLNQSLSNQIVERKNEETAHKRRESYISTILDSLPLECWAMDTENNYTIQNAASRKAVGNVVDLHISDLGVSEDLVNKWTENNNKVFAGETVSTEYDLDVNGNIRHYENMVVPVRMEGKIIGLVGNAIDITVKKRAAEELQQRELLISTLYSISNAIHTADNLEQLYTLIKTSISKLFDVPNFSLALYDEKTDVLDFKFSSDDFIRNISPVKNASQSPSLTHEVIKRGEILLLDEAEQKELVGKRGHKEPLGFWSKTLLGIPLKSKDETLGALVLNNYESKDEYNQNHIDMLVSVADQITLAIQRKRAESELEIAQKQLVQKAHKAGMADIANYTMHVIGNILNSLKTSIDLLTELHSNSAVNSLIEANTVLKENLDSLEEFMMNDARAKKLIEYYLILGDSFKTDHTSTQKHLKQLREKADSITRVVKTQHQSFSGAVDINMEQDPKSILDEISTLRKEDLDAGGIKVSKHYTRVPKVVAQRTKLLYAIDLITENAIESLEQTDEGNRNIAFFLEGNEECVQIVITDTGEGIEAENLTKIFAHGYSSRTDKNGFGLHTCASFIEEMKGKIWAESDGVGKGTSIIISLPAVTGNETI